MKPTKGHLRFSCRYWPCRDGRIRHSVPSLDVGTFGQSRKGTPRGMQDRGHWNRAEGVEKFSSRRLPLASENWPKFIPLKEAELSGTSRD